MRLINKTRIPDDLIREIIAFVKPKNLPTSKFDIRVTNCSGIFSGVCYSNGYHDPKRPHIIVRITKNENLFPFMENYTPTKRLDTYYNRFNDKTGNFEEWRHREHVPKPNGRRKGYIDSLILSRTEALAHVLAHELRHLWQKNHVGKRGKVWRARGKFSERDADAYAIRKVREWRQLTNSDALELSARLWNQYADSSELAISKGNKHDQVNF